jgi:hypothetical protein
MRQKFDVGDLVQVRSPVDKTGVIVETKLINEGYDKPEQWSWHPDEYHCKIKFLHPPEIKWVRAKLLTHLSKINE